MPVTVSLPTALRSYADNQSTLELEGDSVGELLNQIGQNFPQLKPHLFTDEGELRNFVNVFVNDDNIRDLQLDQTAVKPGDEVMIVPAVAGGSIGADAATGVELSKEEIERYSRHLIIPEVGMEGQKKLKAASILLVGTGGLGSPLAMYLAAAGIGRLGLVDFDVVDASNLQRQVIHRTEDIGKPKLDSAERTINGINPYCQVDRYNEGLTSDNAMRILEPYDIVIDGTDNFPTRYLVNDACVLLGKPNVYGSIFRFEGQASVFNHDNGPCYRCVYPDPPPPGLVPSCAEGGVLGILPGLVGLIQATEAIKIILRQGDTLNGRLLLFDALPMKFRQMKVRKDPTCPVCGPNPTVTELIDYDQFCGMPSQEHSPEQESQTEQQTDVDITPRELKKLMDEGADIVILDVRKPHEYDICNLGGTLIPVDELPGRFDELDEEDDIIVHCRSGGRSANAVDILRAQGFENVRNLRGGILAWADEVDPSVPKY